MRKRNGIRGREKALKEGTLMMESDQGPGVRGMTEQDMIEDETKWSVVVEMSIKGRKKTVYGERERMRESARDRERQKQEK